ncbi:hypothetical protein OG500_37660 [Kitasatospora sp. NBC_01250]|uniref:hypothetical protein n=1 Tax=Kitasatospora sp. NBC_01250 TaxID=2903571 RepID=UPI002E310E14|nr:hypothetical protein [Kitasatospora sp. NBC_01250]
MRKDAAARQAALDEATAAERETIRRRNYNWPREPEDTHRSAIEDAPVTDADEHARQQRQRHRAALATRAGGIPLRTDRPALPRTGAA